MDWGLLAGGVSRGINEALQGQNTGMLQGEEIRHRQAGEDIQQQYLQNAQSQLTNQMAQQAFANAMARRQLEASTRYHEGQLAGQQSQLDLARTKERREAEMQPYDIDLKQAHAQYYRDPKLRNRSSGTQMERYKNPIAQQMGYDDYVTAPPEVQAEIDRRYEKSLPNYGFREAHSQRMQERYTMLNRLAEETLANPRLSGADAVTRDMALAKLRAIGWAMSRIQNAQINSVPADPRDLQMVETQIDTVWRDLTNLQNAVAGRGAAARWPGQTPVEVPRPQSFEEILKGLGLTPPAAKKP